MSKEKKFNYKFKYNGKLINVKGRYSNTEKIKFFLIEEWYIDGKEYLPWDSSLHKKSIPSEITKFERAIKTEVYYRCLEK